MTDSSRMSMRQLIDPDFQPPEADNKQHEQHDTDGAAAAAASSTTEQQPSLTSRASHLWGTLRSAVAEKGKAIETAVSEDARFMKHHIFGPPKPKVVYSLPVCLHGAACKNTGAVHRRTWRHPCPYGRDCNSQTVQDHMVEFTHDPVLHAELQAVRFVDDERNFQDPEFSDSDGGDDDGDDGDDDGDNKQRRKKKNRNNNNNNKDTSLSFLDEVSSLSQKNSSSSKGLKAANKYPTAVEIWARGMNGVAPLRLSTNGREYVVLHYVQTTQWTERGMAEMRAAMRAEQMEAEQQQQQQRAAAANVGSPHQEHAKTKEEPSSSATSSIRNFFPSIFSNKEEEVPPTGVAGGAAATAAAGPTNSDVAEDASENSSLLVE